MKNDRLHHSPPCSTVKIVSLLSETVSASLEKSALPKKQSISPVQVNSFVRAATSNVTIVTILLEEGITEMFLFFSSEPNNVRLVGGHSGCRGTLEMRRGVEWKAFSALPRGFRLAGRVCSQLNCGSVISVGLRRSNSPTTKLAIIHDCDASSLADCFVILEKSGINVEITCSGKLLYF